MSVGDRVCVCVCVCVVLQTLLCRVFLSGRVSVGGDICRLLLRLHKIVHIISETGLLVSI